MTGSAARTWLIRAPAQIAINANRFIQELVFRTTLTLLTLAQFLIISLSPSRICMRPAPISSPLALVRIKRFPPRRGKIRWGNVLLPLQKRHIFTKLPAESNRKVKQHNESCASASKYAGITANRVPEATPTLRRAHQRAPRNKEKWATNVLVCRPKQFAELSVPDTSGAFVGANKAPNRRGMRCQREQSWKAPEA